MSTPSDRELLEAAAKAAGYEVARIADNDDDLLLVGTQEPWNPLSYDADALRLAVKLRLEVSYHAGLEQAFAVVFTSGREFTVNVEDCERDECAATRRAVVLAAASLSDSPQ